MPFKPRFIESEEPPQDEMGELQLPDELAALAEQLTDDANFLAARFPAEGYSIDQQHEVALASRSSLEVESRPKSRRLWTRVTAIAATVSLLTASVLVAAVVYGPSLFQDNKTAAVDPTHTNHNDRQAIDAPGNNLANNKTVIDPAGQNIRSAALPGGQRPGVGEISPAVSQPLPVGGLSPDPFLLEVSGPEMEGLFDLWEQEAPARTSVEI